MDWTHISKLARLFVMLGVAPSLACGDDSGTSGTDDDSSTSADDDDDDDDGPSTMTDPTTPTEESSTGDTAPTTSSDGSSSSDGGSSSEGSTGSTGSTGADSSGSSSEGSTTSSVCEPITDDPSAINQDCMGAPCPEGYTCQDIVGFQFQQLCEIICVEDCECPEDHYCAKHTDKTMVPWFQCDPL
jgi:hypothetical protein